MRIAVTGGSGRVGTYVVAELMRAGHDVIVLDLLPPAPGVRFMRCDLLDMPGLRRALAGVDAIAHLGGLDQDRGGAEEDFVRINVGGTWNLLQAAHELAIGKVVLASSITATGLNEARPDHPPLYLPIDEAHPRRPIHPYGVSKLLVEEAGARIADRGRVEVIALRPMLVVRRASIGAQLRRAADRSVRSLFYWVSAEDCARAFRLALEAQGIRFGAYFVTAADTLIAEPTLDLVRRLWPEMPEIRDRQRYADDPLASPFSGDAAQRALGFTPTTRWTALARDVV